MTKHLHLPDEITAKVNLSIEQAAQIGVADLMEKPSLAFCARAPASKKIVAKPKVTAAKTAAPKERLSQITNKLYDLEAFAAPKKTPTLDLGIELYQMETTY